MHTVKYKALPQPQVKIKCSSLPIHAQNFPHTNVINLNILYKQLVNRAKDNAIL